MYSPKFRRIQKTHVSAPMDRHVHLTDFSTFHCANSVNFYLLIILEIALICSVLEELDEASNDQSYK